MADKIKTSDIIQDDALDSIIGKMVDLEETVTDIQEAISMLGETVQKQSDKVDKAIKDVQVEAKKLEQSVKSASGATKEGRKTIDEATIAAQRLARAQEELSIAQSKVGQRTAYVRSMTAEANKESVLTRTYLAGQMSSYKALEAQLKLCTNTWKNLTAAQRADDTVVGPLIQKILNLRLRMAELSNQTKGLAAATAKYDAAGGAANTTIDLTAEKLKQLALETQQAERELRLNVQVATSAKDSYNQLSAQYQLNVMRLNAMSAEERNATETGKALEEETRAIYFRMIEMQEAVGNSRLSVGNYRRSWDGLGWSITQVVRELPAAAVSLNTFFLGISNNIPMVVDEIQKLRIQNKLLAAEGKEQVVIWQRIIKSLLNWNTVLVIGLAVFSKWGKQIIAWIGNLLKGEKQVISFTEAMRGLMDAVKESTTGFGKTVVSLHQLQNAYALLRTEAEKTTWIEKNQNAFAKLGVAVNNVNDADRVFVKNTASVIEALRLRAMAQAAQNLAAKEYEKALELEAKLEYERIADENKEYTFWQKLVARLQQGTSDLGATNAVVVQSTKEIRDQINELTRAYRLGAISTEHYNEKLHELTLEERNLAVEVRSTFTYESYLHADAIRRQQDLQKEIELAKQGAKVYEDLGDKYLEEARAELTANGLSEYEKPGKTKKSSSARGRQPRDLNDIIMQNNVTIQKRYEESITKLQKDEFAKRRKEAEDAVQNANNQLNELLRRNEKYIANVDGRYKELTAEQKAMILQQNAWIFRTIGNNLRRLALETEQIEREQQVNSEKIRRNTINVMDTGGMETGVENRDTTVTQTVTVTRNTSQMEKSLVKERELLEANLQAEYELILDTNQRLREEGDESARTDEEIMTEWQKERLRLFAEYDERIYNQRSKDIDNQLSLVKKGSKAELELLKQQVDNQKQLAIAQNAAAEASVQIDTKTIEEKYAREMKRVEGDWMLTQFKEQQEYEKARFDLEFHNQTEINAFKYKQEKELYAKMYDLWKNGYMPDISDTEGKTYGLQSERAERDEKQATGPLMSLLGSLANGHKVSVSILGLLGLDEDSLDALDNAVDVVTDYIQDIYDAEVELAEKEVELAEERVERAQSVYDAEVEARNNGYANNVATAKKELEDEKRNQAEKQKLLEKAQKQQERIDALEQTSSLITASAEIWKSLAGIPIVGPALAIAATATMWTSFAAAKIKAKQISQAESQLYGEGGLEFIDGGSHASGNDVPLGIQNNRGKQMVVEGGEAVAVVNKKRTRQYHKYLPGIIDSLNRGVFEDKYLQAFNQIDGMNVSLFADNSVDLSSLEKDVQSIRRQNEVKYYVLPNGNLVIHNKNVRRIVKR